MPKTKALKSSDLPQLLPNEVVLLTLLVEHGFDNRKVLEDPKCPYVDGGGYYSAKKNLKPYIDQRLEQSVREVEEVLKDGAPTAMRRQIELMGSKNERIALDATKEVLTNLGIGNRNQTNIQVNNFVPLLGGDSQSNVHQNNSDREDTEVIETN